MLASTSVYFEPDWPVQLWNERILMRPYKRPTETRSKIKSPRSLNAKQILILCFLAVFLTHQIYTPLRHFGYPGDGKVDLESLLTQHSQLDWRRTPLVVENEASRQDCDCQVLLDRSKAWKNSRNKPRSGIYYKYAKLMISSCYQLSNNGRWAADQSLFTYLQMTWQTDIRIRRE